MATIATAEVQVIADTRRFVPDLRRKLRAAFASLGNQLGDDIVQRIDRRITQRLTTVMNQAARTAGRSFSQSFDRALSDSGLSRSLQDQLGGAASRRGAQRAGAVIADAMGEGFRGSDKGITDAMLDAIRTQTIIRTAGLAGQDTAEAFTANFRQNIRNDMQAAFDDVEQDLTSTVPSIFHRTGRVAGDAFAESISDALEEGLEEADTPSAFVTDFLNGIDRRQGQVNQRMGRAGALAAAAFFTGVQNAQAPFGGLPSAVLDNFDDIFEELEQTTRVRMRNIGASIRDNIGDSADVAGRAVRRLGSAIADIARGVTITPLQNISQLFSDFTTNLGSAAAMGLVVLGVLEQLTALLFALPAALALASAGVVTMVTAFGGMGAAFSAARGSAEEFEDAIEGLAPAAQGVVTEFRALDDELDRLRLDAQEALWSELEGAITRVADNLGGPLHAGIVESSGALGELINGFADFAAEEETAATIAATFDALTGIFQALADEIQPFLGGLRTLTDEFLPELETIEGIIDGIGTEFQEWADAVTQGDLLSGISPAQRAFQEALETLQQLGRITGNVAAAVGSVFDAAERNGSGFLDLIERITEEVAAAFASPEGQDTLAAFLDDLVRIADVVLSIIGTIIEQFPKLSGPVADLAEAIGPDLEEFISNLGDGIAELITVGGPFFQEIAEGLGNLDLESLGRGLGLFLRALAPIVSILDDILNFVILIIEGIGNLAFIINALGRVQISGIQEQFEGIGEFFSELGPRIADGFQDRLDDVEEFFATFGSRVAEGFGDRVEDVTEFFARIGRGFMELFGQPIIDGVTAISSAVGGFFSETLPNAGAQALAFLGNLALDIFNGLVGIGADIIEWASGVLADWTTFWTGLKDNALLTLQTIGFDVTGSLTSVRGTFTGITTGISEGWNRFWTGVKDTARNALNTARDLISNILSSIRSTINGWIDGVRSRWSSFWNGLSGIVSGGLSAARSSVDRALNGIRDAFNNLSDRVRSILNGLRDFISGIFSRIQGIVDDIAGAISGAVSAAQNLGNIDLNPFANGGIVNGPTAALVGEAGREVIIPLTRPQRAVELVQQSGLMGLLAAQGALGAATGGASGTSPEIHVHSALADPEQIARRAVRILERQAARGLARTGG